MNSRRDYNKAWAKTHKESVRASNRKQYLKNREARIAMANSYRINNAEKVRRRMAEYHRERYYPKHRDDIIAKTREYARSHPSVRRKCTLNYKLRHPERYRAHVKARNTARSARERGADVGCPEVGDLIRKWRMRKKFECYYCGETFPISKMNIDHKIAISRGGKHEANNVCMSCFSCNIRKKNYHQDEPGYRGQMVMSL